MSGILKLFFPESLKKFLKKKFYGAENFGIHHSQCGEDLTIGTVAHRFLKIKSGFFIDVGSFHPQNGSNTYLLYKKGWRGINIDPRPGSKKLFDAERPGDINLEIGISEKEGILKYYYLGEASAYNSFSKESLVKNGVFDQVLKVIDCPVMPLSKVLNDYLPPGKEIDYLNIDAEGFEMEVLSSFDLVKWQPKVISLEQNNVCTFQDVLNSGTTRFLQNHGYQPIGKNIIVQSVSTITYIHSRYITPSS